MAAAPADSARAYRRPSPPTRSAVLRAAVLVLALALLGPQAAVLVVAQAVRSAQDATAAQDYAAAADVLGQAAARLPYDGYLAYRAGLAEISAGRFADAIRHIQASAALDGWSTLRHIALGDAYAGLHDTASALAEWELARGAEPDNDAILARLANNYEAAGRYPEAIEALTKLAGVRGNDTAVFYRLALLTAVTVPADALARLALVADIAPELAPPARSLMDALEAGRASGDEAYTFARVGFALVQLQEWRLAEVALSQAVALNSTYADAFAYLGLAQDMQQKDGLAAYEQAVTLAPESPLVHYLLGLHWRRQGDSSKALPYLQAAQKLDPKNPALAAEIAGAYASQGELASAETWFTEAVRLDEKNPDFWLLLARFYVDHEYHVAEYGLPAARQAVGLNPNSALAADALGYALTLTGDLVDGQKMLERAVALDGQLASGYYHLGLVYAQQGQTAQAQAAFNHTLSLDPDGPYGGLAIKALARLGP